MPIEHLKGLKTLKYIKAKFNSIKTFRFDDSEVKQCKGKYITDISIYLEYMLMSDSAFEE